MSNDQTENQAAKSVDSIDWLAFMADIANAQEDQAKHEAKFEAYGRAAECIHNANFIRGHVISMMEHLLS